MKSITDIAKPAKDLSRNPIGIIALFIVLVYGFACLLFVFSADSLEPSEKQPIIWFVVSFPILVLFLFAWLVSKHHNKLYAPKDYRDDEAFLASILQKDSRIQNYSESHESIEALMEYGKDFDIILQQEKRIKADFIVRGLDLKGGETTVNVLIRHLAASQVLAWFEVIYGVIYGTQIRFLRNLEELESGLSKSDLENYFGQVQQEHTVFESESSKDYYGMLYQSNLIMMTDGKVVLSSIGHDFLKMLTYSAYSDSKGY